VEGTNGLMGTVEFESSTGLIGSTGLAGSVWLFYGACWFSFFPSIF
jgi:hypothetical protein